jgi:FixJ family two-component response regulator
MPSFEHRLRVYCDRLALTLSYLRPFPNSLNPTSRIVPSAWCSTFDFRSPIVFITGYGDVPMSVQAMKGGAIEFLIKPFRDQDLLEAIQLGIARDRARRENERSLRSLRERFESLSPREREVMIQVVQGRLSKQIAGDIGISEITVKVHRSHLMKKMKAGSLPELGRMADRLKLVPDKPRLS